MIFCTEDPLKRKIVLLNSAWEHIQKHEHVSVESVKMSIETPEIIIPSVKKPNYDIYYKLGVVETHPQFYVSVVVGFNEDIGKIVTAHLAKRIRPPGPGGYKYVKKQK